MKTLADEECRAEIARRLATLRPDSRALWGIMSAPQMVCHLSDSFRVAAGEKRVSDATGVLQRTLVKWTALYLPVPWPRNLPTRPEIDQRSAGTAPGTFADDVAGLLALLDWFSTRPAGFAWHAHPIFGRMSSAAWLRWGYLHMDHHLRQFGA